MQYEFDLDLTKIRLEKIKSFSTCWRRQVGCIIYDIHPQKIFGVEKNRVLALATNKTYHPTEPQCLEKMCDNSSHHHAVKKKESHAEVVALSKLIHSNPVKLGKFVMVVTLAPCIECAKRIVLENELRLENSQKRLIDEIYYFENYKCMEGVQFLIDSGIKCERIEL